MLSLLLCLLAAPQNGGGLQSAEAALTQGDFQRALHLLSAAPLKDARWHSLSSKAYDGLNDPARAVAEAEAALNLEPANPAHHLQLAQIFLSRNTPNAALEILNEADGLFPNSFVIRLGKGLALKELLRYEESERELAWCLTRQPASALAFDALATVYLQQSRFGDAGKAAAQFRERNPSDYRGSYFLAAAREGELQPPEETRRLLNESLEKNPKFAASHALLGKIFLREGNAASAARHLTNAIGLRPDLVQAHLQLARALRSLGDEAGATREFETVRRLKEKEQEPVPSLKYSRKSSRNSSQR